MIKIFDINYEVMKLHKIEQWDELYIERFVPFFKTYYYIVGDFSADKLRLKGFHKKHKMKVLEEYIKEHCAFDAPYFILKREDIKNSRRK